MKIELLGELVGGQFTLESALADIANADPSLRDQLRGQLGAIASLRQQVGTATGGALVLLRGEVAALAGNAAAAAQDARTSASANASGANNITTLASTARQQTAAVMAGMKDFEPYMKFASPAEEAEYRQREAERRAYIAAEQAKGTPQGDLNASGAAVGQMADAAANGAGESPEFQKRWEKLTASTEALRAQIVRDGGDVAEFDAHLREDLRRILKSKGLSDTQIDAQFAAHPDNPLEAAKAFVADQKGVISDTDIGDLSRKAASYRDDAESKPLVLQSPVAAAPTDVPASALEAMADLKAMGVVAGEHNLDAPPAHGVKVQVASPSPRDINARA